MTRIPASIFPSASTLNILPNVASTRTVRQSQGSLIVTDVCQDPQDPTKVIIGFSLTNINTQNLLVEILDVDGDSSYGSNGTTATIYTSDIRTYQFPVRASSGAISGKVVANFGAAISNFLEKFIIEFRLSAVAPDGSIAASDLYTWRKTVLPRPVGINYLDGVLQVQFQYDGTTDCSCSVQCVAPTGVFETLTFCPDQRQTINVNALLEGDPFNFSILVSDALGNTSSLAVNAISNVKPYPLTVSVDQKDIHDAPIVRVNLNLININGIAIPYKYYQIIKFDRTQNNYYIWKDWTSDPETVVFDYSIRSNETYGYAVRYKGEFGDTSSFSSWTIINTVFEYEKFEADPYIPKFSDGIWVTGFNHNKYETQADAAFPGILYINGPIYDQNTVGELSFPERYKLVHSSVIPKGPNRGKVIGWDLQPVIALAPTIDPTQPWSFQSWTIIDCSVAPTGYKFQNYLMPLGPFLPTPNPPTVDDELVMVPNLFCAGHTWSKNGDLIVAGGMLWTSKAGQYADKKTFSWNPALPNSVSVNPEGAPSVYRELIGGHYGAGATGGAGFGAWTQGPDLNIYRYYPTLTASHYYTGRLGGRQVIHAFGGTANGYAKVLGQVQESTNIISELEPGFINSYESLIITNTATSTDCGFELDFYNGTGCFKGPQTRFDITNDIYVYIDGFYTYPRMHTLTDGSIFMSSPAPKSSRLTDPDNNPGVWSYTNGYDNDPSIYLGFRRYGSDVTYPNFSGDNIIMRTAGDIGLSPELGDLPPGVTGWESNSVQIINPLDPEDVSWREGPPMKTTKGTANLVILPDGTLFSVGGAFVPTDLYPLGYEGARLADGVEPLSFNPWTQFDHHHAGHSEAEPDNLAIFRSDGGDRLGYFAFHRYPEVLYPGAKSWKVLRASRMETNRHYHSTAVLLPDGRVLVGGGENRQIGKGLDYEIFEPHYLRPPVGWDSPIPRPKGIVITDAAIVEDIQHNAYQLNYNTQYTITCDDYSPFSIAKVVLMAPCSTTHHSDLNQKYRQLSVTPVDNNTIVFTTPENDKYAIPGFYMLFVLSNMSIPSEAIWVKF